MQAQATRHREARQEVGGNVAGGAGATSTGCQMHQASSGRKTGSHLQHRAVGTMKVGRAEDLAVPEIVASEGAYGARAAQVLPERNSFRGPLH